MSLLSMSAMSVLGGVISACWIVAVYVKFSLKGYNHSIQTEIVDIKVSANADEVILIVKYLAAGVYKEYSYVKKAMGKTDDDKMDYISNFMRTHPLKTKFKMLIKKDAEGNVSMVPFVPVNKSLRKWTFILIAYIGLFIWLMTKGI